MFQSQFAFLSPLGTVKMWENDQFPSVPKAARKHYEKTMHVSQEAKANERRAW